MTELKNPIVFTGNRLLDGEVVWLGKNGVWVENIEHVDVVRSRSEQERVSRIAERADAENVVVEPYEIDVAVEAGVVTPVKFRERIRATGPTVRLDLGKQASPTARAA